MKIMNFKTIESKIKNFGKNIPTYWGCALAGETGETCNIIKKLERDGMDSTNEKGERYIDLLPAELADVFIYTSLTARFFSIDLESAILTKLAEIQRLKDEIASTKNTVDSVDFDNAYLVNSQKVEIAELKSKYNEIGFQINKMFDFGCGVPEGFMGTLAAKKMHLDAYRKILDSLKKELGLHCYKGCGYGIDDDKILPAVVKLKNDPMEQNHRVITVCGSTQYIDDIKKWAWERKKCGDIVFFTPFTKEDNSEVEAYRSELESQWFQMIRMADLIFIFNKDGHIGEHTKMESEYAKSIGKPIEYLENPISPLDESPATGCDTE